MQAKDKLTVCGREYELLRLLGKGKGGYSWLVSDGREEAVLKQIHHEPCAYYTFGDKVGAERFDRERLERAGIRMPKLLALDVPAERIVKEYIEGPTVFELVRDGLSAEPYLPQVRAMAAQARAAGLNLDYFPANFVVRDGLLWYVDYECNAYSDEWNFENWGIRYWSRTPEFKAALRGRVTFRPYTDGDYEAVCAFLAALVRADESRVNWNWARFEWMAEHPEFDKSRTSSIGLWCEDGRVVGAAIYDMYFGEAFCGVLPAFGFLYPDILDYAYRELKDEAGLGTAVCDGDAAGIGALRTAGFEPAKQSETVMEKDLRAVPDEASVLLPEGVCLTELDPSREDLKDVQWLFWQGFDHGSDRTEFEEDFEKTAQELRPRRHFDPALSLAARTLAGELISYCCLWVRPDTGYAYVEPVCTVPAWRGKGIAGALLQEAFRRAKARGAEKAFVISDLAFYEKLGFRKKYHYTFYWKA